MDLTQADNDLQSVPFAYLRVSLKNLILSEWKVPPQWIRLREDRCFNVLKCGDPFPSLLLSLRGGTIDSFDGTISPICRPFVALKTEGNIDCVIKCTENNALIDRVCVYLNGHKVRAQINGEDPFQIVLKKENVSIYDRLTIHRICTQVLYKLNFNQLTSL